MPQHSNKLFLVRGDATQPQVPDDHIRIIPHCANDIGVWGAGFTSALNRRWYEPEHNFNNLSELYRLKKKRTPLGMIQLVEVGTMLHVANMIGQTGVGMGRDGVPPIRYDALREALTTLASRAEWMKLNLSEEDPSKALPRVSFHCPKFGAGLAGGDWNLIQPMVEATLLIVGDVYIYEF